MKGSVVSFAILDIPSWRLWTHLQHDEQRHCRYNGSGELPPPCIGAVLPKGRDVSHRLHVTNVITHAVHSRIGDKAQEDAKSGPHLPGNGNPAADCSGRAFGGIDGDSAGIDAESETKNKSKD